MRSTEASDHLQNQIPSLLGRDRAFAAEAVGEHFTCEQFHSEEPELLARVQQVTEHFVHAADIDVRDAARLADLLLEAIDSRRQGGDVRANSLESDPLTQF